MENESLHNRLLDVAVDHFGRLGLNGANTRAIAADAGTLMSSITYHFGGKEGLYLASADHIATFMRDRMRTAIERGAVMQELDPSVDGARKALRAIFDRAVETLTSDEAEAPARFIAREQADPGEAFTRIYEGMMDGMITRIASLILQVSGNRIEPAEARIRAIALFGQVLVFRVARATVLAANDWPTIAAEQVALIQRIVADHLDAVVDRLAGDRS